MAVHADPGCVCWSLEGCVTAGDCISVIAGQECPYLHVEVRDFRCYKLLAWEQVRIEGTWVSGGITGNCDHIWGWRGSNSIIHVFACVLHGLGHGLG